MDGVLVDAAAGSGVLDDRPIADAATGEPPGQ